MKCDKCGYNWNESGDSAHVCFAGPLDVMLRNAIMRSAKVVEPKREWVGLTDDEMEAVRKQAVDLFVQEVKKTGKGRNEPIKFGRLVEAKLKEKNT